MYQHLGMKTKLDLNYFISFISFWNLFQSFKYVWSRAAAIKYLSN